jgi:hypothetical protein
MSVVPVLLMMLLLSMPSYTFSARCNSMTPGDPTSLIRLAFLSSVDGGFEEDQTAVPFVTQENANSMPLEWGMYDIHGSVWKVDAGKLARCLASSSPALRVRPPPTTPPSTAAPQTAAPQTAAPQMPATSAPETSLKSRQKTTPSMASFEKRSTSRTTTVTVEEEEDFYISKRDVSCPTCPAVHTTPMDILLWCVAAILTLVVSVLSFLRCKEQRHLEKLRRDYLSVVDRLYQSTERELSRMQSTLLDDGRSLTFLSKSLPAAPPAPPPPPPASVAARRAAFNRANSTVNFASSTMDEDMTATAASVHPDMSATVRDLQRQMEAIQQEREVTRRKVSDSGLLGWFG